MILTDYKPKYNMIELMLSDVKNFRISQYTYCRTHCKVIDYESACEGYGYCRILSVRNDDHNKITSIIVYEKEEI